MEKDRIILKKRFDALMETLRWIKKENTFELERTSYLQRNTIKGMLTEIYKNGLSNKTGDIYFDIWITDNFNIQVEFPSDFGSEELKNDFFNIFDISYSSNSLIILRIESISFITWFIFTFIFKLIDRSNYEK